MRDSFAVYALTDVGAVSVTPDAPGQSMVRMPVTAFKRAADGVVQEGLFELAARVPAERAYLYAHALSGDSIVRVRVTRERGTLWMQTLPEPADDPELAALCAAQTAGDGFDDPVLGRFVFDRTSCVYRCTADWLGHPVSLETESGEAEDAPRLLLRAVCDQAADWDVRLQQALQCAAGVSGTLDSILAGEDGLTFWLVAGDRLAQISAEPSGALGQTTLLG